jgi:hypothetical protein
MIAIIAVTIAIAIFVVVFNACNVVPWFREVVGVVGGVYDTNILIPTLRPFSPPKKKERNSFLTLTMAQPPPLYLNSLRPILVRAGTKNSLSFSFRT